MNYSWYEDLLRQVMNHGHTELNQRTGVNVRTLANRALVLDCSKSLPMIGLRRTFPHVAAAELAWTLSGVKEIQWLLNYTRMWENFQEEDGTIEAAYGYRWRHHFKRDQLMDALETLRHDPSNRQVVVMAWDPGDDGLLAARKKNVPCPLGFSLNIVDKKLNMAVYLRSSDVVVGLPYDVMHYALLLDVLCEELAWSSNIQGLTRGSLMLTLAHAHVYDTHFDTSWKMLESPPMPAPVAFPLWRMSEILNNPDEYVKDVKRRAAPYLHPYHERVEAVL